MITTHEDQMLALVSASEFKTNHVLHLILTLITFGLWSTIWMLVASRNIDKRNKIKAKAGLPTQTNTPKILLWINVAWIVLLLFMVSSKSHAASNKESCLEFLGAGMYNGALEETCGFSAGVKEKLKKIYTDAGCGSIVPPEEIDQMFKDVLNDTRSRVQSLGEKAFCKGNKKSYYALSQ